MKHLHTLSLALLLGVSGLGCATAPPGVAHNPEKPIADSGCRDVTSLTGKVHTYCGTPDQWTKFDSQMAALGQGFSCKPVKGARPLCLFAKQWDSLEHMKTLQAGTLPNGFFDGARESAMAIEHNEYPAVRQDLLNSANGRELPIP